MGAAETQTPMAFRPIGYWLKHLDGMIEQSFERCLAEGGLSRRQWQTMNILKQEPVTDQGLNEALRPFLRDGAVSISDVTYELVDRGWVGRDRDGRYMLTREGEAAYVAIAIRVHANRQRTMDGLSQADYQDALRVLRRMAENLAE